MSPMRLIAPKARWVRSGRTASVSHSDTMTTVIADDTSSSATYPSRAFTDNSPLRELLRDRHRFGHRFALRIHDSLLCKITTQHLARTEQS